MTSSAAGVTSSIVMVKTNTKILQCSVITAGFQTSPRLQINTRKLFSTVAEPEPAFLEWTRSRFQVTALAPAPATNMTEHFVNQVHNVH